MHLIDLQKKEIFKTLFSDNLLYYREKISSAFGNNLDQEKVWHSIERCLFKEFESYFEKICIVEARISSNKSNDFINDLKKKFEPKINIFLSHMDSIVENIINMLNSLDNDSLILKETYHKDISLIKLTAIEYGLGDFHNNSASVAILHFDQDKLVFKPRNAENEKIINNLYYFLNAQVNSSLAMPIQLSYRNYSWSEYIEYIPCANSEEIKEYYFNLGALLAALYLLNATDIHFENIIVNRTVPYLVDCETIFSPLNNIDQKNEYSVLMTELLPYARRGENIMTEITVSGLANPMFSNKFKNNPYKTRPEGKEFHIEHKCFSQGFEKAYVALMKNKECIDSIIFNNVSVRNLKLRSVIKPTKVYYTLLLNIHHPLVIQSKEKIQESWSHLEELNDDPALTHIEIEGINYYNIPYFYHQFESWDLHALDNSIPNYYKRTAKESFEFKKKCLSKNDLEYQLYVIELSFKLALLNSYNHLNYIPPSIKLEKKNSKRDIKESLYLINKQIENISYTDKRKKIQWLTITHDSDNYYYFSTLEYDLYGGKLGIAFNLLYYNKLFNQNNYYLFKQLLSDLNEFYLTVPPKKYGVFEGIGGYIYVISKIEENHPELIDIDIVTLFSKTYKDYKFEEFDVAGGLAGFILLSVSLINKYRSETILDICLTVIKNSKDAFRKIAKMKEYNIGFYHGLSGLYYALCELQQYIENKELDILICKVLKKINSTRMVDKNDYSWCNGSLGLSIPRLTKAPDTIKHYDDLSLCHGLTGLKLFHGIPLKEYNDYLLSNEFRSGTFLYYTSLDLMNGISGMSYCLLKELDNTIPNVLVLE